MLREYTRKKSSNVFWPADKERTVPGSQAGQGVHGSKVQKEWAVTDASRHLAMDI